MEFERMYGYILDRNMFGIFTLRVQSVGQGEIETIKGWTGDVMVKHVQDKYPGIINIED